MPTNLDAYAAQFFREIRRVGSAKRSERMQARPVSDRLLDEIMSDPESAWPKVLAILDRAKTWAELEAAAAGPLEDVLMLWGPQFAERMAVERKVHPKLNEALEALWPLILGRPGPLRGQDIGVIA